MRDVESAHWQGLWLGGRANESDRFAAGTTSYISKPFKLVELRRVIVASTGDGPLGYGNLQWMAAVDCVAFWIPFHIAVFDLGPALDTPLFTATLSPPVAQD